MQPTQRLYSLDALRGLSVAAMLIVNNQGNWDAVFSWVEHAHWHGVNAADYIFPLFLFIVGASFELASAKTANLTSSQQASMVLRRATRLFAFGISLHLIAMCLIPGREFRLLGVLQRIAICYAVLGLVCSYWRSSWQQLIFVAGLLLLSGLSLYWGGNLLPHQNLADKIDTAILGKLAWSFDPNSGLAQEPEGILSSLGAIISTCLGMFAMRLLRRGGLAQLLAYAAALLLMALLCYSVQDWNKHLWTPAFALWTGAWSGFLLAAAHYLIDQRGLPAIGRAMGVNAIGVYGAAWVLTCVMAWHDLQGVVYRPLAASLSQLGLSQPLHLASLVYALLNTAIFCVLAHYAWRRNWRWVI